MKRYILDEVATYEEATNVGDGSEFVYFLHENGEIIATARRNRPGGVYGKLTVLEGSPEAIAEAMMVIGNNALADPDAQPEEPIPDYPDTLANLGLSEADFR